MRKSGFGFRKSLGGLSRLVFISLQLLSLPVLTGKAHAWGHSTDLNSGWLEAQLVNQVSLHKQISYCVEISDPRFMLGTIQRQVDEVLRLWLKPLEAQGIRNVAIAPVNCSSGLFNLKIEISPENTYTSLGSYEEPRYEDGHFFSFVKINSSYLYRGPEKTYNIVDFETFVPSGRSLGSWMNTISVESPQTVQSYAINLTQDYYSVFWSTYRILMHELGHSFGLCDTYAAQIEVHCDRDFMTATQPSSVMMDSNYFYLTDDDVAGVQSLFRRYAH